MRSKSANKEVAKYAVLFTSIREVRAGGAARTSKGSTVFSSHASGGAGEEWKGKAFQRGSDLGGPFRAGVFYTSVYPS